MHVANTRPFSVCTPLKFGKAVCVMCGKEKPDRCTQLQSNQSLRLLLLKYCEINVAEGLICRNCSRQLNNLQEKIAAFKHQALHVVTLHSKRLVASDSSPLPKKRASCATTSSVLPSKIPIPVLVKTVSNVRQVTQVTASEPHHALNSPAKSTTPSKIPTSCLPTRNRHVASARRNLFDGRLNAIGTSYAVGKAVTERAAPIFETEYLYAAQLPNSTTRTNSTPAISEIMDETALVEQVYKSFIDFRLAKCTCGEQKLCERCLIRNIDNARQQFASIHHWKHGKISVLCSRSSGDELKMNRLLQFSWSTIVDEFRKEFPQLFYLLVGLMAPDLEKPDFVRSILPRIAVIYGIVLQTRANDMSFLQRMVSLVLLNSNTEFHVSTLHCRNLCSQVLCLLSRTI